MKKHFIQFSLSPNSGKILTFICVMGLILAHMPQIGLLQTSDTERDGFPERRRDGGTHWIPSGPEPSSATVIAATLQPAQTTPYLA